MRSITPLPVLVALAVAAALLTGCGSSDPSSSTASSSTSTDETIVVTTSIWADVTSNVACDGLASVETVIPIGGDPHSFEPSLRDRETMENASLIVANGLLLEESLADTLDAVENGGVEVLRVGDHLDALPIGGEEIDHDHEDRDDGHDHGDFDPHVWFDPTLIAAAVPEIVDALAAEGLDRPALEACADGYLAELEALDQEVVDIVDRVPPDARTLVTNHDSLQYFAHRYGFDVLGSIIPSSSSLAEANAADLDDLAAAIDDAGVPAIFAETQHSSSDADALADRLDDVEVVTLMTGTLGEPGSDADTYVGWIRTTATTIADALTGTTGD